MTASTRPTDSTHDASTKPAGHRHHAAHQAFHGHGFGRAMAGATHRHANRAALSSEVDTALHTAMAKEGVPASWAPPLRFIIGEESNGRVGAANGRDTARGLFQLTRASYHLNPNGAGSFGNPVEEAQGGIRYIERRYQTADNAMDFWQKHGWY